MTPVITIRVYELIHFNFLNSSIVFAPVWKKSPPVKIVDVSKAFVDISKLLTRVQMIAFMEVTAYRFPEIKRMISLNRSSLIEVHKKSAEIT